VRGGETKSQQLGGKEAHLLFKKEGGTEEKKRLSRPSTKASQKEGVRSNEGQAEEEGRERRTTVARREWPGSTLKKKKKNVTSKRREPFKGKVPKGCGAKTGQRGTNKGESQKV